MSIISSFSAQGGLFSAVFGTKASDSTDDDLTSVPQNQTTTATTSTTDSDVSISQTAAEKADNAKDFAALAKEVRSTLDVQYSTAKAQGDADPAPDLSGMTGRALAAIALDKDGAFSTREIAAAKSELGSRTRSDFTTAVTGGTYGRTALAAYSTQLVESYDAMSSEEREARGWTTTFRSANEAIASATQNSLFDQLDAS